jgi:hypothetical protein
MRIFSQTALRSTCEFWVNPVNFTFRLLIVSGNDIGKRLPYIMMLYCRTTSLREPAPAAPEGVALLDGAAPLPSLACTRGTFWQQVPGSWPYARLGGIDYSCAL